jgi:hypothetical protein
MGEIENGSGINQEMCLSTILTEKEFKKASCPFALPATPEAILESLQYFVQNQNQQVRFERVDCCPNKIPKFPPQTTAQTTRSQH